ncbi:MAG: helix-turn-helix transcriptional regulator [Nodosilinea sp.]
MTLSLSQQDYWALFEATAVPDSQATAADEQLTPCPTQLGQGYVKTWYLRPGLTLDIADYQLHRDILTHSDDRDHPLEYTFYLSDPEQAAASPIPYHLYGSGMAPGELGKEVANRRSHWVSVHLEPEVFRAVAGYPDGDLPEALRHLIGDCDRQYYIRPGQATPGMQIALQQILQCPYQGCTQRIFLESKVLELMALILEQEIAAQDGKHPLAGLKPDDVDRLHWAREVLHQNFDQPLSLAQLARQVGLNECSLKQGFRQLFDTTVFSYLRRCRMERARLLLLEGRMNVGEAAQAVGYTSRSRFAVVFRKTFGVNPKAFSVQRWQ